tara:strand:+ start:3384 stop:3644 length:261 start_codon:yes stop_codon:yes gene_type:complete
MEEYESPTNKIIVSDGKLKELFVNYVGNKLDPENDEVTMGMVIDVLANEFPEVLYTVAEENFLKGYETALDDVANWKEANKKIGKK